MRIALNFAASMQNHGPRVQVALLRNSIAESPIVGGFLEPGNGTPSENLQMRRGVGKEAGLPLVGRRPMMAKLSSTGGWTRRCLAWRLFKILMSYLRFRMLAGLCVL